jgi:hypothetical protein
MGAVACLFWIVTILCVSIGAATTVDGLSHATSAPQQAAAAAMGITWAVIPYCFTRAVSEIFREIREDKARRASLVRPDSSEIEQERATPKHAPSATSTPEAPWDDPSGSSAPSPRSEATLLKDKLDRFRSDKGGETKLWKPPPWEEGRKP